MLHTDSGGSVFIRHTTMEPGGYPGGAYWKGKISQLRSAKDGHFAQVQWYYSKQDLQELGCLQR
jgi:hypothetical protein